MSDLKIISLGDKKRSMSKKKLYKEILSSSKKVKDIIQSKRFDYLNNVVRNKKVVHFADDEKKQESEKIKKNINSVKEKLGILKNPKNNLNIKEDLEKEIEIRQKEIELLRVKKQKELEQKSRNEILEDKKRKEREIVEQRQKELLKQQRQKELLEQQRQKELLKHQRKKELLKHQRQKEIEFKKHNQIIEQEKLKQKAIIDQQKKKEKEILYIQKKLENESNIKQKQLESLKKKKFLENIQNRSRKKSKIYRNPEKNDNSTPILKYFNQQVNRDALIIKKSKSLKKKKKILEIIKLLKDNRFNFKRINIILNKLDKSYVIDLLLAFNLIKKRSNAPKKLLDIILINYITSDIIITHTK